MRSSAWLSGRRSRHPGRCRRRTPFPPGSSPRAPGGADRGTPPGRPRSGAPAASASEGCQPPGTGSIVCSGHARVPQIGRRARDHGGSLRDRSAERGGSYRAAGGVPGSGRARAFGHGTLGAIARGPRSPGAPPLPARSPGADRPRGARDGGRFAADARELSWSGQPSAVRGMVLPLPLASSETLQTRWALMAGPPKLAPASRLNSPCSGAPR
jgi:hypothetical protein